MVERRSQRQEHFYICGQCGIEQYAVVGEEAPVPCVDCGYSHRELKKYDIPSEIKLNLTQYS